MMKRHLYMGVALIALSLSGCGHDKDMKDPWNSMSGMKKEREARLATAASEAIAEGKVNEALPLFEQSYGKKPSDPVIAVNYAQLLRKSGRADKALEVLSPIAVSDRADGLVLNEYAASLIETDQAADAELVLTRVINDPTMKPYHADAQNQLGVAYASQGRQAEAETMFRQAWEGWRGDATSVMNNLGLAQANQGKFDQALTTLRRALALAPHKTEIARNIDIVTEWRAKAAGQTSKIQKKPAE